MDLAIGTGWLTHLADAARDGGAGVTEAEAAPIDLDLALVARARRGDRDAFESLVRRHQRGLWRMARRYLRSDADASDVTQQAFVRAYRALDGFRGDASVRSWLYRIGMNLALNHLRDRARERPTEIDPDVIAIGAVGSSGLEAEQQSAALRTAIAALPPKQKMVLELRVYDELSFREVAALCACTENAAKVSFHFAVKRLRLVMAGDGANQP